MEEIKEEKYKSKELFTVDVDTNKLVIMTVGQDSNNNFILNIQMDCNNSSAYYVVRKFYKLTDDEFLLYLKKSKRNRRINIIKYLKFKKLIEDKKKS